jgi:hypothetical protein
MSTTTFTYKNDELVCMGERYPSKTLTISTKCDDLDAHELLDIFKSFMLGCGYAEKSFYDACYEACQEHPRYRKSGNGHQLGTTGIDSEKIWQGGYQDPHKYPTGM